MNDIERLQNAIRILHGCEGRHVASIAVHETFQGKTAWKGVVEVLELVNNPQAKEAYGWIHKTDSGETRHVVILGIPPIDTAANALRAFIDAEAQKQKH